jgi:cytochrome b
MNASHPPVRIWDLPLRLFHWLLAALFTAAIVTVKIGGDDWMVWHERCGRAILVLLAFRLAWGFAGSRASRFAAFVRGPRAVLAALRELPQRASKRYAGHNPLGGWSVLAMLGALAAQGITGLFANDDATFEGPLATRVSKATSDALTGLHTTGEWMLYALVALHMAAIAWYWLRKGDNLVTPMITGDKAADAAAAPDRRVMPSDTTGIADGGRLWLRAAVLLVLVAAVVLGLTTRG